MFGASGRHRMNDEILRNMIGQFLAQADSEAVFTWQGGEPTLMGLGFFRRAVELQKRFGRGLTVGNAFQTNGLLLDSRWTDFFREYRFLVGLSIDGPSHVHDRYRRDSGGQGTFSRVADSAGLLLDSGVDVNALAVVNDYSAQFPEEIYGFFKDMGLVHMQFTPCVEILAGSEDVPAPFSVGPEDYGRFLCVLFDLWLEDFRNGLPTTSIRLFESLLFAFAGMEPPQCTLARTCGDYVVVEHNGEVYSCDFFVTPRWRLGNLMTGDLSGMFNSPLQREFGERKAALPSPCRECPWLPYCRGGCPKDRIRLEGNERIDHLCEGTRMFLDHAGAKMEKLVRESLQRRQGEDAGVRQSRQVPAGHAHTHLHPPAGMTTSAGEGPGRKPGRNDPCPCGSGLKYKKCCGR